MSHVLVSEGPIVRISPEELHCNDPEFIDVLYAAGSNKRNKYGFMTGQFGFVFTYHISGSYEDVH